MKISFEKSRVILQPEKAEEKAKLEALWRILVDCVGFNKKLVPIGEYVPMKNSDGASFFIEGLEPEEQKYVEVRVEESCKCYCRTCNKLIDLKAGDVIPNCCGKMMDIID